MPLATAVIMAFLKDVIADAAAIARERRAVFSARLRSAAIIAYEFSPSADVESFLASESSQNAHSISGLAFEWGTRR